ncbi:glycosyltransferase family 4 protein [Prevotella sp.]|uniref:glycosyltransferase family 4 protein n=1 Tax=Prevotella sp. TaxID=59823 RepID=UPI002F91C450
MKLAIDCRFIGKSGIGTFIENVCHAFSHIPGNEYLLIGNAEKLSERFQSPCFNVSDCRIPPFSVGELWRFPTATINQCDAFFTPSYNIPMGIHVPIYAMIHDTVQLDLPQIYAPWRRLLYKIGMKRALHLSRAIFTVSDFSRSRIKVHFTSTCPIHVVSNGISSSLQAFQTPHPRNNIPKDFIVYLGNLKPYKGLDTLLAAYQQARRQPTAPQQLYIIGNIDFQTRDKGMANLLQKGDIEGVQWICQADNERIFDLIQRAKALIAPSRYEGFGLVPLEAMYLGTPAIISDIPAHREVYAGTPALFFKAGDAETLAYHLKHLPEQRINCRDFLSQRFDYKHTAKRILDVIHKEVSR